MRGLAKFAHGMAQYSAYWDFKNLVPSPTINPWRDIGISRIKRAGRDSRYMLEALLAPLHLGEVCSGDRMENDNFQVGALFR